MLRSRSTAERGNSLSSRRKAATRCGSPTPPWVRTVRLWAESSRREVCYALCDDRRTLLWFGNQRAIEYHPTLFVKDRWQHPTHLVIDVSGFFS